jgi:hypothetical protein
MTSLVAFTSAVFFSVSTPVTRQLGILESNVFANYQLLGQSRAQRVIGTTLSRTSRLNSCTDCPPGQVLIEVEGGRPSPM